MLAQQGIVSGPLQGSGRESQTCCHILRTGRSPLLSESSQRHTLGVCSVRREPAPTSLLPMLQGHATVLLSLPSCHQTYPGCCKALLQDLLTDSF